MKITITQRIGAGFSILVALMLLMSFFSFQGLNKLNGQMTVSGQEIAPMLVSSGGITASLLSANKTLMQFLGTSDNDLMDSYDGSFNTRQEKYQAYHDSLKVLSTNYPIVNELLSSTHIQAEVFLSRSQEVSMLHREHTNTQKKYLASKDASQRLLVAYKRELDDIVSFGDNHKVISAATTISRQLEIITENFNQFDDLKSVKELTPIKTRITKTIKAMHGRISKLSTIDSSEVKDISTRLNAIEKQLTSKAGALPLLNAQLERKDTIKKLMVEVTASINSITDMTDELMLQVEAKAQQAEQDATETSQISKRTNFVISLMSVVIATIIAISICRSIRRPLKEVMRMMRIMADGDMSQRLKIISKDEFGDLSTWVNQLAERLCNTITDIHSGCEKVTNTTRSTAQLSEKTRNHMTQQNKETSIVVSSMEEMVRSVKDVVTNTENARHAVSVIDESAQHNRETMDRNTELIQNLSDHINHATEVINRLNERSDAIGHILDVIRGIAEQTNLLALNAAIEAARAGEQGRGFAVVADEVRTLASRTQQSTEEIHTIIQQLQGEAAEAVNIMGDSSDSVKLSVEGIEQADKALNGMVSSLDEIREISVLIAGAAENQNNTCDEVSSSMHQISEMSQHCSNDAALIVDESEGMVKLAQQQQELVNHFTLK